VLLLGCEFDVVVRLRVAAAGRVLSGRREDEGLVADGEGDVAEVEFFPNVGGGILILGRSYLRAIHRKLNNSARVVRFGCVLHIVRTNLRNTERDRDRLPRSTNDVLALKCSLYSLAYPK
jgi:hypothetical protein